MTYIKESPDNAILQEDLEMAVAMPTEEALKHCKIMITGASGLIGSQVVKYLVCLNRVKHADIHIIALVRDRAKAEQIFEGCLYETSGLEIFVGDVSNPLHYDEDIDYIVHGASPTSSGFFVNHPVETIQTAITGTTHVLELAKEKQVKGVVYLSSLEVYGTPDPDREWISESDYGYIEPLSVRSSYSEGKRMAECLCVSYAKEYDVPVKIARLSQTFGAGVNYDDSRVFAEFARCAIEKRNIVLHTPGRTIRSYCYSMDAVRAILTILCSGTIGEAYNVTNMDTVISIRDMAELVCQLYPDANIHVEFDTPEDLNAFGYNPEMAIRIDSSKLMNLGWKPSVALDEIFRRLIESMRLHLTTEK